MKGIFCCRERQRGGRPEDRVRGGVQYYLPLALGNSHVKTTRRTGANQDDMQQAARMPSVSAVASAEDMGSGVMAPANSHLYYCNPPQDSRAHGMEEEQSHDA